jgi:hypothetical protein
VAEEFMHSPDKDFRTETEAMFQQYPALACFVTDLSRRLRPAAASRALTAAFAVFRMFGIHRGSSPAEINDELINRCRSANEDIVRQLRRGRRRLSIRKMRQPFVMQFVSGVLDDLDRAGPEPWTVDQLFDLFLLLKTFVDVVDDAY